jgi:hypothetical protein
MKSTNNIIINSFDHVPNLPIPLTDVRKISYYIYIYI